MNFERIPMKLFRNDGINLAYLDAGARDGAPVLLIHGFASNAHVNWVYPGWLKTLGDAGYRVMAIDNRGHGQSDKPHDTQAYDTTLMADDARALLDHLDIAEAHVMGYSMGARITAYLLRDHQDRVRSAVFGGLGIGLVKGVGDWDPIAGALLAEDPSAITDERGRMFRAFADQTRSDRVALAACIRSSRTTLPVEDVMRLDRPVLIGVGTQDDIAGSARELAELLPGAKVVDIPRRDHMLAVGDKVFKAAVLDFLATQSGG